MMMAKNRHEKVKGIVKAFLVANKGEWFTAKQICDFIVTHNFGLGNYVVSTHNLGKLMIRTDVGIFSDIETRKVYGTKEYCYNGDD